MHQGEELIRAPQESQILSSSPCKMNLEEKESETLKEKTKKTERLKRLRNLLEVG
jgi:hypothetical protein